MPVNTVPRWNAGWVSNAKNKRNMSWLLKTRLLLCTFVCREVSSLAGPRPEMRPMIEHALRFSQAQAMRLYRTVADWPGFILHSVADDNWLRVTEAGG